MKKIVEALGYLWTFGENSVDADIQREQLERDANKLALSKTKPAEKKLAFQFLGGFYWDIMSSLESLEKLDPESEELEDPDQFVLDLMYFPERWVQFAREVYKAGNYGYMHELLTAARECNPHWKKAEPLEGDDVPGDVKAAMEQINQTDAVLDPDNKEDIDHPDTEELVENAQIVADFAEAKAEEAGLVGPQTFPTAAKRRRRGK